MPPVEEEWQRARLFPITGIGGPDEQERRASSALLAVIEAVQEFGRTVTTRAGGPAGSRIEAFIEVPFDLEKKRYRPDGVICVSRGKHRWTALVEVKTGHNRLNAAQVEAYVDIARRKGCDAVLTISHEIPTTPGVHPVTLSRQKLQKVSLQHLSWGQIHTEALIEQFNKSISDRDQAWILSQFIRYLEEPKSGALDFDDMGPSWVSVRDSSASQTLRATDQATLDVVARFNQLVVFAGMALARQVGVHVQPYLSRKDLSDQAARLQAEAQVLAKSGQLEGNLQIPNAIAPIGILVDLRANRIDCSVTVDAPSRGRQTTKMNWLLRQLSGAPDDLRVRANTARARGQGVSVARRDLFTGKKTLVEDPKADIRSFTLTLSRHAGTKRGQGRGSFVHSVITLVETFYVGTVQHLKAWAPAAPKVKATQPDDVVIDGPYAQSADAVGDQVGVGATVAEVVSKELRDRSVAGGDGAVDQE